MIQLFKLLCFSRMIEMNNDLYIGGYTSQIHWANITNQTIHLVLGEKEIHSNNFTRKTDYLSIYMDGLNNYYDWYIPIILSNHWENDFCIFIKNIATGEEYQSNIFHIAGINIYLYKNKYIQNDDIYLDWVSNINTNYNIYLYDIDITEYNIRYVSPITIIAENISTNNYIIYTNILNPKHYKIVVSNYNNNIFDISNIIEVIKLTTPTTSVSSDILNDNGTHTLYNCTGRCSDNNTYIIDNFDNLPWWVILVLLSSSFFIICIGQVICKCCNKKIKNDIVVRNPKIHPNPLYTSQNHSRIHINNIYDSS
jgi:hypothetical protein